MDSPNPWFHILLEDLALHSEVFRGCCGAIDCSGNQLLEASEMGEDLKSVLEAQTEICSGNGACALLLFLTATARC